MKQLYKQLLVDKTAMRLYTLCAECGRRFDAGRVPLICRNKKRLDRYIQNAGSGPGQRLYNHSLAKAVQYLARYMNRCPQCGDWICDDCFDLSDGYGACKSCTAKLIKM